MSCASFWNKSGRREVLEMFLIVLFCCCCCSRRCWGVSRLWRRQHHKRKRNPLFFTIVFFIQWNNGLHKAVFYVRNYCTPFIASVQCCEGCSTLWRYTAGWHLQYIRSVGYCRGLSLVLQGISSALPGFSILRIDIIIIAENSQYCIRMKTAVTEFSLVLMISPAVLFISAAELIMSLCVCVFLYFRSIKIRTEMYGSN